MTCIVIKIKEEGALKMKGTAVLFQEDQTVTFLENVNKAEVEDLKKKCGCGNADCKSKEKETDATQASPILWCADQIDWDYGY